MSSVIVPFPTTYEEVEYDQLHHHSMHEDSDDATSCSGASVGPVHLPPPAVDLKKTTTTTLVAPSSGRSSPCLEDLSVISQASDAVVTPPSVEEVETPQKDTPLLTSLPTAVLANALSFLPIHELQEVRQASPAFEEAASYVAPRPLHDTDDVVFVRYEPQAVTTGVVSAEEAAAFIASMARHGHHHHHGRGCAATSVNIFPWRCMACGQISQGPRNCQHCHATLSHAACRVFLGQIRKDLSAEMAQAMLRQLVPAANILHIEAHTNAGDGRGKGCAWVYVNGIEDALLVTSLHKRVFVDQDGEGSEGYWYVLPPHGTPEGDMLIDRMAMMADTLAASPTRRRWLPRQPLVAELPGRSMLAAHILGVAPPARR